MVKSDVETGVETGSDSSNSSNNGESPARRSETVDGGNNGAVPPAEPASVPGMRVSHSVPMIVVDSGDDGDVARVGGAGWPSPPSPGNSARFTVNRISDEEAGTRPPGGQQRNRRFSGGTDAFQERKDCPPPPRKRSLSDAVRERALVRGHLDRMRSGGIDVNLDSVGDGGNTSGHWQNNLNRTGNDFSRTNNSSQHGNSPHDDHQSKRRGSNVSVTGKVPQMYLQLLEAAADNNQETIVSTIGDLPVFPNTFGADPSRFGHNRRWSFSSSHGGGLSRPPSYDGSSPSMVYYDVGPVAPCNRSVGGPGDSRRPSGDYLDRPRTPRGAAGDEKFEMSWDKFQDALVELRGRMSKHGGFYNVASTYFLLTYSGHGFKHWFLPMGFLRKSFWIVLVLFFVYAMIDQSVQTVQNYWSYPKSVSVYVVDEDKAEFPAITVCNFNMLSKSRLTYQAQRNRSTFPKRLEDVLNLQARFEKILRKQKNGELDYKAICTDSYLHWQSPSLKVAPVKQPWPYLEEERQWDATVLELRKNRLKELVPEMASTTPANVTALEVRQKKSMNGLNPCQQMKHFGVLKSFSPKQWKVAQWELETGYNFTEGYQLPQPQTAFNCSKDGETLLGLNDTALADVCGKAFYDPTSNRPCLSSYFQSDGIPLDVVCFPLNRICDGAMECGSHDDTDEVLYCDANTGKPKCDAVENLNACDNGLCYESSLQCDGFEDCSDGTDEMDCQGLKFDKSCGCYVICETKPNGEEECYRLSPFDGVYDGNVEKVMWRSKTAGDFNDVTSLLAPTPDEIRKFGVRGQDFIVSCSFDGVPCSYKDFFKWQNEEFGNCFTFNSPLLASATSSEDKIYKTTKYGYRNGLRLSLNIEMDDYLSAVTPTQGARMVIHDRNEIPFPAENGIDLSPLVETAVVVKRKHIQRVPSPHGKCDQGNEDVWTTQFDARYSSLACAEVCRESLVRKRCGCSKSLNPVFSKFEHQLCSLSNRTQRTCVDETVQLFHLGDPGVREEAGTGCQNCAPSCDEWIFEPTTSGTIKNKMFQFIFSSINKVFLTDDFCAGTELPIESGTVHAHVYLDTLSHEYIVESPAYTFQQFVSNVGGIWGLFAGFSIITFIEWIEIAFNFLLHVFHRAVTYVRERQLKARAQKKAAATASTNSVSASPVRRLSVPDVLGQQQVRRLSGPELRVDPNSLGVAAARLHR